MKITIELEVDVLPLLVIEAQRAMHELYRATDPADHTLGAQEDRRRAALLQDAVEVLLEASR